MPDPLPHAWVTDLFGRDSGTWRDQGVQVFVTPTDFEVRAADGDLLGLVGRDTCGPDFRLARPVIYRAVIRENANGTGGAWAVPYPQGFIPPRPAFATAGERARWGGTGEGTAGGVTRRLAHVVPEDSDAALD